MYTTKYLEQLRRWRGPKRDNSSFKTIINQIKGQFTRRSVSEELVLASLESILNKNLFAEVRVESIKNGMLTISVDSVSKAHKTSRILKGPALETLKKIKGTSIYKVKVLVR